MIATVQDSRKLTKSEKIILKTVTENGPIYGYKIKKIGVAFTDKTIYTTLKNLTKSGLLKKISADDKDSPGQTKQIYHLNLLGLTVVLGTDEEIWEKIDDIAEIWKKLLELIFGEWNNFVKAGLHSEVILALKETMSTVVLDWKCSYIIDDEWILSSIENRFIDYFMNYRLSKEVSLKFDKIIESNKKLKQKISDYLNGKIEINTAILNYFEKKLEKMGKKDESEKT